MYFAWKKKKKKCYAYQNFCLAKLVYGDCMRVTEHTVDDDYDIYKATKHPDDEGDKFSGKFKISFDDKNNDLTKKKKFMTVSRIKQTADVKVTKGWNHDLTLKCFKCGPEPFPLG